MDTPTNTSPHAPWIVQVTKSIEAAGTLDGAVATVRRLSGTLVASPARRQALQGDWLGHSVHPLLTDLPLGTWTSATLLDLFGGRASRPAARRLLAFGLVSALPTAVTGLAEFRDTGQREQRVGVVHAVSNSTALAAYTASLIARRNGSYRAGVAFGLLGGLAAGVGGYLGAHLTEVRKVSTRHPAFVEPRIDPGLADSAPQI